MSSSSDARQQHGGPAAEAQRTRTGRSRSAARLGRRASRRRRRATCQKPAPRSRDEQVAALDLLHDAGHHVAHGGRGQRRHRGDAHTGRLEAGRRRPRAVDGVDDEDELGVGRALQAAVLRVAGPVRRLVRHVVGQHRSATLVDVEGHVAAHGVAGVAPRRVLPERRQHDLAQARAQLHESAGRVGPRGLQASGTPILPCYTRRHDREPPAPRATGARQPCPIHVQGPAE